MLGELHRENFYELSERNGIELAHHLTRCPTQELAEKKDYQVVQRVGPIAGNSQKCVIGLSEPQCVLGMISVGLRDRSDNILYILFTFKLRKPLQEVREEFLHLPTFPFGVIVA